MVSRACDQCGQVYEPKRRTSKYCGSLCRTRACRQAQQQGAPREAAPVAALELAPAAGRPEDDGSLALAALFELRAAGRADGTLGRAALALASRVDAAADTGAATAALVRELRATMEAALAGAPRAADALDDLAARRARKVGG